MEFYSNLPVLVPAVIGFVVVSVVAIAALAWNKEPDVQTLVRRAWLAIVGAIVLGVVVFWIATAMVEGPKRATVDRSLQQEQQGELGKRVKTGGH